VAAARPYARHLGEVIGRLLDPALRERYPLLRQPVGVRRAAIVMLTSNRGLAGAFNGNLIREARALMDRLRKQGTDVEMHAVGRKGAAFFRFRKEPLASVNTEIGDRGTIDDAGALMEPLRDRFERGDLDEVYVVYAQFRSAMSTPPAVLKVLPIEPPTRPADGHGGHALARDQEEENGLIANYLLSPSAEQILDRLLPLYVRNTMYRALVETSAAEHGARRTAMKSATDNAGEILDNLSRTYNRARQAQITQEIAEIVGGAAALE
jgi:F-type H+-transporting ATPase subunit gamma